MIPVPFRRVAICVPVRDEEATLRALMEAIRDQRGCAALDVVLCLYLDGCGDGSAGVAATGAGELAVRIERGAHAADANAGRARRRAMALGLDALGDATDALILTTDADSVPARDWVASMAASLADCDVVAGLIERDGAERDPLHGRVETYYDRLYGYRRAVDPVAWEQGGLHHFTGGANLGFRVEAYRALGGFAELPSGEDATLVDDAGRAGLRVRRTRAPVVRTSARRQGRAPGGLAAALRHTDAGHHQVLLARPSAAAWQYARHALARAAYPALPDRAIAAGLGAAIGLGADHVVGVARDCRNAEAFAMRIVPAAPDAGALVPLAEAERMLTALEAALLERAA